MDVNSLSMRLSCVQSCTYVIHKETLDLIPECILVCAMVDLFMNKTPVHQHVVLDGRTTSR